MVDIKENEILTALSAPNTQEAGLSAARDAYGALVRRIIANVLTDPRERERERNASRMCGSGSGRPCRLRNLIPCAPISAGSPETLRLTDIEKPMPHGVTGAGSTFCQTRSYLKLSIPPRIPILPTPWKPVRLPRQSKRFSTHCPRMTGGFLFSGTGFSIRSQRLRKLAVSAKTACPCDCVGFEKSCINIWKRNTFCREESR